MVKRVVVDTTSRSSGDVWYFAYGSNLHPQRRATRAALSPLDTTPGTLCGWRLVFDMPGVPPADPAMASIRREAGSEVHGLLLRLTAHQFAALVGSEGGDRFYVREQVEVIAYDDRKVIAEVFIAAPGRRLQRERTPSRRYLELIREGARLSALRPEYCAWLEALPHAEASPRARWASDVFLEVFMRASRGRCAGWRRAGSTPCSAPRTSRRCRDAWPRGCCWRRCSGSGSGCERWAGRPERRHRASRRQ
ncbi:gamma-glutamylcyclotransferase [Nannocystis pusilla]|uniref:Gamma-glutamylcyclotransferase n=1 Tax=Nannocystis pusilla TaxID=889268 RepID=A0A9X3EJ90_9BACT|nr:gamma-glutamylcyclotransferase [Nannocystis pusilla]